MAGSGFLQAVEGEESTVRVRRRQPDRGVPRAAAPQGKDTVLATRCSETHKRYALPYLQRGRWSLQEERNPTHHLFCRASVSQQASWVCRGPW